MLLHAAREHGCEVWSNWPVMQCQSIRGQRNVTDMHGSRRSAPTTRSAALPAQNDGSTSSPLADRHALARVATPEPHVTEQTPQGP
jgi:hypothetical protein